LFAITKKIAGLLILIFGVTIGYDGIGHAATDGPKLTSAYMSGNANDSTNQFMVVLQFEESDLKTVDIEYAYTQFIVNVGGNYRNIKSAFGGGTQVILMVEGTVGTNERVHVSYFPSIYPLTDQEGNKVEPFQEYYVSKGTDWTRPKLQSITASGRNVMLQFDKELDLTAKPDAYQFVVKADQAILPITEMHMTSTFVSLLLVAPVDDTASVTVSYMSGQRPLLDLAGNSVDQFTDAPAENKSKSATIVSSSLTSDVVVVTFDKALVSTEQSSMAPITVKANGKYVAVKETVVNGKSLMVKLYDAISSKDQVTVSYNNRSYNALETADGMTVRSFTDYKVTGQTSSPNNSGGEAPAGNHPSTNGNSSTNQPTSASVSIDPAYASRAFGRSPAGIQAGLYTIPGDHLKTAFDQIINKGMAGEVTFSVPQIEAASLTAFPLQALIDSYSQSSASSIAISFKDLTVRVPLKILADSRLAEMFEKDGRQGYLLVELDGPAPGIAYELSNAAAENGAAIKVQPVHVALSYTFGTSKTALPKLATPISVELGVAEKLNAGLTAMVRVDEATGELTYVPTTIRHEAGRSRLLFTTKEDGAFAGVSGNNTYADTKGHWAEAPIGQLTRKFIADGRTADEFRPNQPITRGEFAAYLARGLGLAGDPEAAKAFKDLRKHADQAFIGAALSGGIVKGVTASAFDPDANITREQMAVMLVRSLQVIDPIRYQRNNGANVLGGFRDRGTIAAWAQSDAAMAVEQGLLTGVKPDLFSPKALATRAEAAAVIQRLLVKIGVLTA